MVYINKIAIPCIIDAEKWNTFYLSDVLVFAFNLNVGQHATEVH